MGVLTAFLLEFLPFAIVCLVVFKLLSVFKRRHGLQKSLQDFPGPRPHLIWGNMKELTGDYEGMLRVASYASEYDGAFPVWMGPTDAFLMTVHPTTVKYVLSGSDPKDEFSYSLMRPWIGCVLSEVIIRRCCEYIRYRKFTYIYFYAGDGLLLSKGRKWDRNRRMMTPAFHQDIIKNYVKIFSNSTKILLKKWSSAREPVETFHHVSLLTLDSMMQCLFGHESDCQNEETRHPYIQAVYDVSELIIKRIMTPYHHNEFLYYLSENGKQFKHTCDVIHKHSERLIANRRKLMASEKHGSRTIDFLDILLTAKDNEGNGMTDTEIRDEVDTFMFEGHDSTASTLSWCLYNFAKYPQFQDKCREEIDHFWGHKEDIVWDDITKLKYTHQCIKESMRLYPAVPNVSRCAEKDIQLPDGRVIPKGVRMAVSIFALHRNPDVWPEPEEYDPARFSAENTISSMTYMPFSVGPRNCIGQLFAQTQIRVIIPMVLRAFRLSLDPTRPAEPESMLILRSKNGLYLNVHKI